MARRKGLEPLTYWFVASHSIQLSYRRLYLYIGFPMPIYIITNKKKSQLLNLNFLRFMSFSLNLFIRYLRKAGFYMDFIKCVTAGKDYICLHGNSSFSEIDNMDKKLLCDRHYGIGAEGIFTFYQNSAKNSQIKGFLSNGKLPHDYSSASICTALTAFLTTSVNECRFSFKNSEIFTFFYDYKSFSPRITCEIKELKNEENYSFILRRTELGNRILTLTVISLHDIFAVHFSENKEKLNLQYLGKYLSHNSLFRKRANLILAEKTSDNIYDIDFYENKTGNSRPTIAAFGATAIAACLTDNSLWGKEISVKHKNDIAHIFPISPTNCIIITDAKEVFRGITNIT